VATLLGIFEDPSVQLPANLFIQREISLSGSQGYHWDFQDALSILEHGCPDLDALITNRLPLKDLQQGFDILRSPESRAVKVVICS
jgi:threonine dehydrogenase-like Zn-dependent dehydrogenase